MIVTHKARPYFNESFLYLKKSYIFKLSDGQKGQVKKTQKQTVYENLISLQKHTKKNKNRPKLIIYDNQNISPPPQERFCCQGQPQLQPQLHGVPQYCLHFRFVNFSVSQAPNPSVFDIFQQLFSCKFLNYKICYELLKS